jgi:hypothetical protein
MSRFLLRVITVLVYAVGGASASGAEEDVDARFAAMQARIEQLEAKLAAQGEELAAAKQAAPPASALPDVAAEDEPSFFDTVDVSGFVAASYFYNFNHPDGDSLGGANAPVDLLHPDSHSFSLDQVWLTLSRDASEDQRAGFKADFVYGKTASILSGNNVDGNAGNDFDLYQGYVTYLAPIGGGVTLQAGKFATLIGAEVAQARDNWNVTRGNVYNYLQPINHTGLLASTALGPVTATLGVVDETRAFPATNVDKNNNKALLFGLAASGETFAGSFAGTYGRAPTGATKNDKELILDFIARFTPNEKLSSYVNVDYISAENTANPFAEFDGFGVSAAARFALAESTGLAGRVEYLKLDFDAGSNLGIWGITGTVDHALIGGLTVRGEVRYDALTTSGTLYTGDDGAFDDDDQLTVGIELLYAL